MNRRELLKMSLALPAVVAIPTIARGPKLERMVCTIGNVSGDSGWMPSGQARQVMTDAIRDMAGVLGQGRIGQMRPEPEWLTKAVDEAIDEARERVRIRHREWHLRELGKLS